MSPLAHSVESFALPTPDVDLVCALYRKHAAALLSVRRYQGVVYRRHVRHPRIRSVLFHLIGRIADPGAGLTHLWNRSGRTTRLDVGLDDVEAEISYLLLREWRPRTVVEIAPSGGWSSMWLLHALRDNGFGALHSYDVIDFARHNVPAELAAGRWTFTLADVRTRLEDLRRHIDYLFLDCDHSREFAEWYLANLLPRLRPGTPVSIHDIFHPAHVWRVRGVFERMGEVPAVRRWLRDGAVPHFSPPAAHAPGDRRRIEECRREIGIERNIGYSADNSMVYLQVPGRGAKSAGSGAKLI